MTLMFVRLLLLPLCWSRAAADHPIQPEELAPPAAAEGNASWPVFFLGLQKSGTSSFAHYMGKLGFDSMHGFVSDSRNETLVGCEEGMYGRGWCTCSASGAPTPQSKLAGHDEFVDEMIPARRAGLVDFLRSAKRAAFADENWPLIFRLIDNVTEGRAKFVIWRRNASAWAESFYNFFDVNSTTFNRFDHLAYGSGCPSEITRAALARGYEKHNEAVLEHFASSAAARSRLLDLDFTAPDAGRALCSFVLANDTSCADYADIPSVEPIALDDTWAEQYGKFRLLALLKAHVESRPAAPDFACPTRNTTCQPRLP